MDKQVVLNHLTRARARLLAAIEGLNETEMCTVPLSGAWTPREVLAHISGWAVWDLEAIRAIQRGRSPDLSVIQNVDVFNDWLVAQRAGWPVGRILAEMEDAQTAIQELVGSMSEQQLLDVGPFQVPYWQNLVEWLGVAWNHEEEHAGQIQAWREQRSD